MERFRDLVVVQTCIHRVRVSGILFPLLLILLASQVLSGCNRSTPLSAAGSDGDLSATLQQQMSLEQALETAPEDNRPGIIQQMGPPDAFNLTFEQINGQTIRQEEWSYFDDQTRFDFVDGTLLWSVSIEPLREASFYASYYDPQSFSQGMSLDQVQDLLGDQELVQEDTAENGIPGGTIVAGDQILLGFDQDRLVFVQTFPLMPEVTP